MRHDFSHLPKGWEVASLGSLVDSRGISYGVVQPGRQVEHGVPIIRVNNIRGGRIEQGDLLKISPEIEAKYSRTRLRGGEVLLTLVGTLGQVAVVPKALANWNVARAVAVIPARSDIDPKWLAISLSSPVLQHQILNRATTTVQATLNLRDVSDLPIPLPPATEREAIAHVLGTLDDKIELNRRMNQTLEELARTLFISWFVTFDPVRAKAAGRQPKGMDAATAALFPDELNESEIGEVPVGWSTLSLDSIARFTNGLALQKHPVIDSDPGLPVIKIAQLRKGSSEGSSRASSQLTRDFVVDDGDVLFSWSGSLELVIWTGGQGALNQHLFKVTSEKVPWWFFYLWIDYHLPWFRDIAASKATTMGHIQRRHLTEARVAVPPFDVLMGLSDTIDPLLARIVCNSLETRTLAYVRDVLLPGLLSGEVRVSDAESLLTGVIG